MTLANAHAAAFDTVKRVRTVGNNLRISAQVIWLLVAISAFPVGVALNNANEGAWWTPVTIMLATYCPTLVLCLVLVGISRLLELHAALAERSMWMDATTQRETTTPRSGGWQPPS